ncbi:MAG TPA: hypothetical protein VKV17_02515 [Bryobacteraceae bacterium]|nr:hypothetical protein [Bryobacteraceae bacterium]
MAEGDIPAAALNVVLAEFNALRGEIKDRSASAYTLLNINITGVTAITGFVLSGHANPLVLLIVPLFSSALGMLFVDHSYNIKNIGAYINSRLRPEAVRAAANRDLLAYEEFVGAYEQKAIWRFLPFWLPLTMLFAGPPIGVIIFVAPLLKERWAFDLWIAGVLLYAIFLILWGRFLLAPFRGEADDRQQTKADGAS